MASRAFSPRSFAAARLSANPLRLNWPLTTLRCPAFPTQIRCEGTKPGWKKPKKVVEEKPPQSQETVKEAPKKVKTILLKVSSPEFTPETIGEEHVMKIFKYPENQLPDLKEFGYPRFLGKHFAKMDKPVFCYRDCTRKLLGQLEQQSKVANCKDRIILCGDSGVGKSATLMNVVSYYKSKNWFIFYIPNAVDHINGSMPYTESHTAGLYDQATLAAKFMARLANTNAEVIKKMVTTHESEIVGVKLPKSSPLSDLFKIASSGELAKAQGAYSTLLKELSTSATPVLIAVDEVNTFYGKSEYRDRESRPLTGENFTISRLILDFFEGKSYLANGVVIGAMSHIWGYHQSKAFNAALNYRQLPPIPHYENVRKEILPPNYGSNLIRVDVPVYSREEVEIMMRHFDNIKLYSSPKFDDQYIRRWEAMSGGNPAELWKIVNQRLI